MARIRSLFYNLAWVSLSLAAAAGCSDPPQTPPEADPNLPKVEDPDSSSPTDSAESPASSDAKKDGKPSPSGEGDK